MSLTARSVLVTGASRGLGLEFVKQILQQPTAPEIVIAACRDPASASNLQSVAKSYPALKIIKLDVENDADIEAAVQKTKDVVGDLGLNLLINNAGLYTDKADGGGITVQTRERLQKHFDVNVSGPLIVVQKFLPLLKKAAAKKSDQVLSANRAGIINISSTMGSQNATFAQGVGTSLDYKCSKTAITMASILLSRELKKDGIFVAALHPGWVQTDMGGSNADITVEESIRGCLKTIVSAGADQTGRLLNYKGDVLPF